MRQGTLNTFLAEILANGSVLKFAPGRGLPGGLAVGDAVLGKKELWYFQLWGENEFASHRVGYDTAREQGPYLELYKDGALVAVLSPAEPHEEERYRFDLWTGPQGEAQRLFAQAEKKKFLHEAQHDRTNSKTR